MKRNLETHPWQLSSVTFRTQSRTQPLLPTSALYGREGLFLCSAQLYGSPATQALHLRGGWRLTQRDDIATVEFSMLSFNIRDAPNANDGEKLHRYNGILYPAIICPAENLEALESFQARPNDVMLVAYPKCGECSRVALCLSVD